MTKHTIIFGLASLGMLLGGCAKHDSTYFPLKAGLTWTYQYTAKGSSGIIKVHTLEGRDIGGKNATPIVAEANTSSTDFVVASDSGIYKVASQSMSDPEPQILTRAECNLKFPLKVGTAWDVADRTWLLSSVTYNVNKPVLCRASVESVKETVTVPAGTFSNCVRIVTRGKTSVTIGMFGWSQTLPVQVEAYEWYAPGVGMVKMIYKQIVPQNLYVNSGEFDEQLQAFGEK